MELLEGESLERCLEKCPLTLMHALQCGIQIAEALENTDIGHCSGHPACLQVPETKARDLLVGARRFELLTPCAQGRCATRLRYAPT